MRRTSLSFFLAICAIGCAMAQCPPPGFPDAGDDCPSAPILCTTLDGYCNTINNNNMPQVFPGCGGPWTLNNDEWFAFYAGSTTITIEVVPSNCSSNPGFEGLQGGIYYGCGGPVMDVQCNCTTNPFTLTSTNFIVGEIYWMVLDGCDGNICDYTINVLSGSTVGAPPADPGPISGPLTVCQNATDAYSILPPAAATIYNWTLNPALGSINSNDNNANVNWTGAGTTQLCVDVANACFSNPTTSCVTIEVLPVPTATLSGSGSVCAEGSTTPVDLTVTFTGTGPWEFNYTVNGAAQGPITTSDNPYTLSVNSPGNVVLTSVESTAGGCPGTVSGMVTITEITISPTATGTDPLCFGSADGSINVTVAGGTGPYTYQWSPSGSGSNPGGLQAGTYSVTVTDADGCTGETSVTLADPPQLQASGSSSQNVDCNNPTGSISTSVSGGTPGYTFQWSPAGSGPNPSGLADGTYFATVTDANGCMETFSVTITIDTLSPVALAAAPDMLNCIETVVILSGASSDTGPNITYQWTGPGITAGGNSLMPTVNQPGTYTLTVTNTDNGCTATASVTVTEDLTPPVALATAPPITCDNPSIIINGNGSDTGPNFIYQWSGPGIVSGGNTLMPTVNQPGTYILTVTNTDNGCSTEVSVTVQEDTTPPAAVATAPPITCDNPTVTISGAGSATGAGITYQWTGPGIVSGATTLDPVVDQPGTYTLTVTDASNGCVGTASVTVEDQTQLPNAVATADPITCANPEITISGNGSSTGSDFSYQWTTADGNISSGANTLNPIVDQPGTYTLTVVNTQTGCENMVSVTVGEDVTPPIAEAGPDFVLTCAFTTVQLDGTGSDTGPDFTYQWTGPGIVSGGNTLMPTVNQPGTYTITVTNIQNGCTATDQANVTEDVTPPIAMGTAPAITCAMSSVQIDGTGSSSGPDFTYQWSGPGIVSGGNTLMPTVNQPGTYTITVTNIQNGCTASATVIVDDQTQIPGASAQADPLTCAETQITISGSGSSVGSQYSYQWTTTDGNIVSGGTSLNPVVDATGDYILTVINNNTGCQNMAIVQVGIDTVPPVADAGPDLQITCAGPNIQLDGTGSSGGGGYSYTWSGPGVLFGGSTMNPTVNQPGTYTLTVTDQQNGCTATDQVEVTTNFDTPTVVIAPPTVVTCAVPEIQIDGSGSTSGLGIIYQWTSTDGVIVSGFSTPILTVASGGTYVLTVTNTLNSCFSTASVTVQEDTTPPIADAGPPLEITCVLQEVPLFGFGSSIGADFTYQWTTPDGNILSGSTALNPIVNEPGTYTLTVTDISNGCTASSSTTVGVDSNVPIANAGPNQTLTCLGAFVTLNGSGSSSGPGFTYSWSTTNGNIQSGAGTLTPQVNAPGLYELTVINTSNGCVALSFVTVDEDVVLPTAVIAPPGEINCNTPQITLDAGGSSSNGNFSYVWNTANGNIVSGQGTLMPVIDQGGNYILTIVNNSTGCMNGTNVMVQENIDNPILQIAAPGLISCTEPQIQLDAGGSSSGPDFQYTWTTTDGTIISGADGPTPTIASGGTYALTILNLNTNCSSSGAVTVPENADLPTADIDPVQELNCAIEQFQLNAAIGGGNNLSFTWTTTNGNFVSGTGTLQPLIDAPGDYLLTVLNDDTGCQTSTSVNVTQDVQVPIADAGADSLLTCLVTSLILDGQNTSSGPDLIYQWSTADGNIISGADGLSPLIDAAGSYLLQVLNNSNSCTSSDTVLIQADTEVPAAVILPPVLMGCADPIVTIDAGGSTGGAGIIYEWTTVDGNILSGGAGLQIDVDAPGTYELLVLDTLNGCFSNADATVIQDLNPPIVDAGPGTELTCTLTDFQLQGTLAGQVDQFVFEWVTTNGNIVSGQSGLTPIIDQAGTYTLVVTDTINQCSAESSVLITQDINLPSAVIIPSNDLNCTFSTAMLDGSGSTQGGALLYTWSTTTGNFVGNTDGLLVEVNAAGSYTLTINDTINSCLTSETVFLQLDTLAPILSLLPFDTINCYNPQLDLNASVVGASDFSINWTTVDGNIISNADSLNPTVNLPGIYTLTITNTENGCAAETASQIAADLEAPIVDAGAGGLLTCLDTELQLQGQADAGGAALLYEWSTTNGNIVNGGNTPSPTIDAGGLYALTATNLDNGCAEVASVSIDVDQDFPIVDPGSNALLNCFAPVIQLDGSGSSVGINFNYQWTTADGNIISGADGLQPEIDSAGTYTLTITDLLNGCTADSAVMVTTDFELPAVDAGPDAELSCAVTALNLNGSGSVGPDFQYSWSTTNGNILSGANSLNPLIDAPGSYVLDILDQSNGCTAQAMVSVNSIVAFPLAAAAVDGALTCVVDLLTLDGTGSDTGPNISYQWTTPDGNILSGADGLQPSVNQAGQYILTVTNTDNGCTGTADLIVPIDTLAPIAEAGEEALLTCSVEDLNLNGIGSSTGPNYSYQWMTSDGSILSDPNTLNPLIDEPGIYVLTVTALDNGCTSTDLVAVTEDITPPLAESNALGILTCVETTVLVSGQGSSAGPGISYNWTTTDGNIVTGVNSLEPTVSAPGAYTLLVLNTQNGCASTATTTVTEDVEQPLADAGADDTLTCAITTLILQGQASGGNPLLDIIWTTDDGNIIVGGTELNPLVDAPGLYQLQVTDLINGCTDFDVVLIGQNIIPPNLLILNPGILTCLQDSVPIDATLSSNGPNYLPAWSTINGNILSGASSLQVTVDEPGTYTLELEDSENGCTATANVDVQEDVEEPIVDAGAGFVFPCADESADLNATATASSNNLQINWQTQDGQLESNLNTLTPEVSSGGTYTLTVINLDNGCSAEDSVEITADFPAQPEVAATQPPCAEDLGSLEVFPTSGGTPPYLYSIDNGQHYFLSPVFPNLGEGNYSVLVQDALGCESSVVNTFIDAPDPLVVSVEALVEILQGQEQQLEVQLNVLEDEVQQVIWTPTEGLSCSDCLNPIASPLETTVYRVEVIVEGDCRSTDEVQVLVDRRPDVYVPNGFSPNGDGQNEVFMIFARNGSVREIRQFLVFSRWGEVVFSYTNFQPNNPAFGWDGRFRGQPMDPAVFTWFAEVEMLDGRIELFKGDVSLVR